MSVAENIGKIKAGIPGHVKLIAVSKTKPVDVLLEAYQQGQRAFGENKVQEMVAKYERLPVDIEWHFIGHLQSNKVKFIVPFVHLIHGVDSLKLLQTIDAEAKKIDRKVSCLLQFYIAEEDTKFGLSLTEARQLLESDEYRRLSFVRISGVMGMATFTTNEQQIAREFATLVSCFKILKSDYFSDSADFKEISMGMSSDYRLAIREGSTMVRIGSSIFGERTYPAATS